MGQIKSNYEGGRIEEIEAAMWSMGFDKIIKSE